MGKMTLSLLWGVGRPQAALGAGSVAKQGYQRVGSSISQASMAWLMAEQGLG